MALISCVNFNDPLVKELESILGHDGVDELFFKLQTKTFYDWKGDTEFPRLYKGADNSVYVYNNRGDSVNIKTFINTFDKESRLGEAKQQAHIAKLDKQAPIKRDSGGYGIVVEDGTEEDVQTTVTEALQAGKLFTVDKTGQEKSEYMRKKGTVIHSYLNILLKNILNKTSPDYASIRKQVGEDVKKRPDFGNQDENFWFLGTDQIDALDKYLKNLVKTIKTKDPKAVIRTEQSIYSKKQDKAGTMDLYVVYSDGTKEIYDFKSINFYESADKRIPKEVKEWKKDFYSEQLNGYRQILLDDYDAKPEDFTKLAIIPVDIQFFWDKTTKKLHSTGFKTVDIGYQAGKDYLKTFLSRYQLTGVAAIDDQLKALFNRREVLQKILKSSPGDEKVRAELYGTKKTPGGLNAIIEGIQSDAREFEFAWVEIDNVLKEYELYSGVTDKTSTSYLTVERLNHMISILKAYNGLILAAESEYAKFEKSDPLRFQALQANLQALLIRKPRIEAQLYTTMMARIGDELNLDLNKVNSAITAFSQFRGISDLDHVSQRAMSKLVRSADNDVHTQMVTMRKRIEKMSEDLLEWNNQHGHGDPFAAFKLLVNPATGNLWGQYKPAAWDEIRTHQDKRDLVWLTNNIVFDKTKYEDARNKKFKRLEKIYKGTKLQIEKDKYEAMYDAQSKTPDDAILNKRNYFIFPKNENSKKNEAWVNIKKVGNEALSRYYEEHIKIMQDLENLTDVKFDKYFVANVKKDMVDAIGETGLAGLKDFGLRQQMQDLFGATQAVDEDFGVIDLSTGDVKAEVPLQYYHGIQPALTKADNASVETKVLSMIDPETNQTYKKGSKSYKDKVDKELYLLKKEKGLRLKSTDLTRNLLLFSNSVYTYHAYKNREGLVLGIKALLSSNKIKEHAEDSFGKLVKDKITKLGLIKESINSETETLFDKQIKYFFYKQGIQNKDSKIGGLSGNKVLMKLIQWMSIKSLSTNIGSIFQNHMGGKANYWINAAEGIFITKANHARVLKAHVNQDGENSQQKYFGILNYLSISAPYKEQRRARKTSVSKLTKYVGVDLKYKGQEFSQIDIKRDVSANVMMTYGQLNGLPVRLSQMPEGTKSLWDLMKVKKDGDLVIDELNPEGYKQMRELIDKFSSRILGEQTDFDKAVYDTNVYFRMLTQFRAWIVPLGEARWGGMKMDDVYNEINVGRYKMWIDTMEDGMINKGKEVLKLLADSASMGIFSYSYNQATGNKLFYNEAAIDSFYNKYIEENPELAGVFTKKQFLELHDAKIKGLLFEIKAAMAMMALTALLRVDWDDDGVPDYKETWFGRTAYNLAMRTQTELTFWISPQSVVTTIKTGVPLTGLLTDLVNFGTNTIDETRDLIFGESAGYIKEGPTKGKSKDRQQVGYYALKLSPMNSIAQFFDFFDDITGALTFGETDNTVYRNNAKLKN